MKASAAQSGVKNFQDGKVSTAFRESHCSNLPMTHGGTVIDQGFGIGPECETPLQIARQFEPVRIEQEGMGMVKAATTKVSVERIMSPPNGQRLSK